MIFLCFFLTERGRGSLANPENTFEKIGREGGGHSFIYQIYERTVFRLPNKLYLMAV